jgi:hypothetical protein
MPTSLEKSTPHFPNPIASMQPNLTFEWFVKDLQCPHLLVAFQGAILHAHNVLLIIVHPMDAFILQVVN